MNRSFPAPSSISEAARRFIDEAMPLESINTGLEALEAKRRELHSLYSPPGLGVQMALGGDRRGEGDRWRDGQMGETEDYLGEAIVALAGAAALPSIAAPKQRNRLAFKQSKKSCGGEKKRAVRETERGANT